MQRMIPQSQQILARALAAHQAGDLTQAEFLYKLVLEADKKQFDALHMLGVIQCQRGNFAAGLDRLRQALRIRPNAADALINLGRAQSELGDDAGAIASYRKALTRNPQLALAHSNLSIVLRRQGQHALALEHCDAALKIAPDYADAWCNRGNVCFDLDRFDEALANYGRALALQPRLAPAHLGRGNIFRALHQFREGLEAYDRALSLDPNLVSAWTGRGNVLLELKRNEEAFAAYGRALALQPDLAEAWLGRGSVMFENRNHADAFAAFDKAASLDSNLAYAEGHRLHAKLHICDWTNLSAEISRLLSGVREGRRVCIPFPLLSMPTSPADQLKATASYVSDLPRFAPISRGRAHAHDRIRLAYVSSDFREHAVAYLTIGMFEHHDRSRFETIAISSSPPADSDFRRRIEASFERFIDVSAYNDQAVADLMRRLEVDIAIDLNGFSRSGRQGAFARRAAPVQVNYLGYAGTMGADYYDYIVADETVIPRADFDFYTEKVAWLPDTFLVTDGARAVAEQTPTRSELGLPKTGFVFCAFNQSHKIDPAIFDVWMRLLQAIDGSVLWLKPDNATAEQNLRLEAERRGVAGARIVFAQPVPRVEDHLARLRQADLFLDTLNYNAHTTASDALLLGVPVLTCIGSTFAGRVAASLLRAIGLPEFATGSLAEYETLALRLAREPAQLAVVKTKLADNRARFPLFDTARFTRNLEAAFTTMARRSRDDEPPQSFAVDPAVNPS